MFPLKNILQHSTDECVKTFANIAMKVNTTDELNEISQTNDYARIIQRCLNEAYSNDRYKLLGQAHLLTLINNAILKVGYERFVSKQ